MSSVTSATFTSCQPYPNATFVTEYFVTFLAACPTGTWPATYTIHQTCTGDKAHWTQPVIPPGFVTTTVLCDVCEEKTQTVTCPATTPGLPAPSTVKIGGNGVTATVTAAAVATAAATAGVTVAVTPAAPTSTPTYAVAAGADRSTGALKKGLALVAGAALIFGQLAL